MCNWPIREVYISLSYRRPPIRHILACSFSLSRGCPGLPLKTQKIEQLATNTWNRYHAHSGVQRADGLYGGLVVHEPAKSSSQNLSVYQQHPQYLVLIGDWYHRRAESVFQWYQDPGHSGYEVWKAKSSLSVSSPWTMLRHTNTPCSLHQTHFSLTGKALTTAQWLSRRIQCNAA